MQKGFTPILILVGIVILAAAIGGTYYFGIRKSVSPIPSPTPVVISTPKPTSNPSPLDETAHWKAYLGKEFQFKYPTNGIVKSEDSTGVSTAHDEGNEPPYWGFGVNVVDNPNHLTTKQVVDKMVSDLSNNKYAPWAKSQADQMQQTMKDYTNGQITGIKLQSFDEGYPQKFGQVVEATENKVYTFSISDGTGGGVSDQDEKLLDQILSTFKFTQ